MLIIFNDMIGDMINNKKLNLAVTEISVSLVFIRQLSFEVPKKVRLNSTHFSIMKIPNKREPPEIGLNPSSDIDFKDLTKICKNIKTLQSDNPLRFRKIFFKKYIIKS